MGYDGNNCPCTGAATTRGGTVAESCEATGAIAEPDKRAVKAASWYGFATGAIADPDMRAVRGASWYGFGTGAIAEPDIRAVRGPSRSTRAGTATTHGGAKAELLPPAVSHERGELYKGCAGFGHTGGARGLCTLLGTCQAQGDGLGSRPLAVGGANHEMDGCEL